MSRKRIIVYLGRQKLFAYEAGVLKYEFNCVTGRIGKETDLGEHEIFDKRHPYTSRTYNVPMNYAMFFTKDGKAIHQSTNVLARSYLMYLEAEEMVGPRIGSAGCVGLAEDDAKVLYKWAPTRTKVEIRK
jgi:hypothetical protein